MFLIHWKMIKLVILAFIHKVVTLKGKAVHLKKKKKIANLNRKIVTADKTILCPRSFHPKWTEKKQNICIFDLY